jgi:hypothetical protein
VDFDLSLPPNVLYGWMYAPGSYQNKPHRPGHYVYQLATGFDTASVVDGAYTLEIDASDTRNNIGTARVALVIANGTLRRPVTHLNAPR